MQCKLFFQVSLQILILKGEKKKKKKQKERLWRVKKVSNPNLNPLLDWNIVWVKKALD